MHIGKTSASFLPAGDPNRDPNWDWTQDVLYTLHWQSQEGPASRQNVPLPYFTNEGPAGVDLTINGDFRREDGWVLVYKDFGTETRPATLPKFLLYNRYRGILRLFYFSTLDESPNSFATGMITQGMPDRAAALLTYGQRDYILNSFDKTLAVSTTHEIEHLVWNYVDFAIIGYEPNLPTDAALDITIFAVKKSDIVLDGTISLEQILERGHVSAFNQIFDGIKSGFQMYKTVDSTKDDLAEKVRDPKNQDKWWREPLRQLLNNAGTNLVPGLAGLASFANAFLGGGSKQVMPLKFEGSLQLTGTITNPNQLHSFQIRVPGAPRSLPDEEVDGLPLYDIPLGIFNLVEKPHFDRRLLLITGAAEARYRLHKPLQIVTNLHLPDTNIRLTFAYVFQTFTTHYSGAGSFLSTATFPFGENSTFGMLQGLAALATVTPQGTEPVQVLNTYNVVLTESSTI